MKQKTKKAAMKRFKVSSKGKVSHRRSGQSHFNARDTSNEGDRKHKDRKVSGSDLQRIQRLVPYAK